MLSHLSLRVCPEPSSGVWTILADDLLLSAHATCTDAIDHALDMAETGWLWRGISTDVALIDFEGEVCLWRAYGVSLQ